MSYFQIFHVKTNILSTRQLSLCALIFAPIASAQSIWNFTSETGDYIGQGQTRSVSFTAAQTSAQIVNGQELSITSDNGTDRFSVNLAPRRNLDTVLEPGYCYERTQRTLFRSSGRPGVDLGMNSRGCNDSMGRFRVRELVLAGTQVTSAAIDVVQHCSKDGGKAIFSNIRINSTVPATTAFPQAVYDASGSLNFTAIGFGVGSTAPGGTATFPISRQNLLARRNENNQAVSFSYAGPIPPSTTSVFWNLNFAAPGNIVVTAGNYPVAVRYPFQSATEAGLDFSYDGSGSGSLTGSFNVSTAQYEPLDLLVNAFGATFVQNREGNVNNRTTGQITYNTSIRNGQPAPTSILKTGFEDNETQPTEIALAYPCSGS
jgi:hypothetical protein